MFSRSVIHRYVKWTRNYFYNLTLYTYYRLRYLKKKTNTDKVLWIDFRSNIFRRRIALLVFWFARAGYSVYYRKTFRSLGSIEFYDRLSFTLPQFRLKRKRPEQVDLILTNRKKTAYAKNEVLVDNNYWEPEKPDTWHVPAGMHPHIYYNNRISSNLFLVRKNNNRRISIFFSGNLDGTLYNWPVIEEKFKILPRNKVIQILQKEIARDRVVVPQTKADLHAKHLGKLVLNDRTKIMIEQADYLEFLTQCSFYLFTPGVSFPLCHNNYEAMAAGCIPITQYAHYHFPNLEHEKNCLVFTDEKDLVKQVNRALEMEEEEINRIRNNVINYYDQYLSEEAIIKNIEQKVLEESVSQLIVL